VNLSRIFSWSMGLLLAFAGLARASESWAGPDQAQSLQKDMAAFFEGCENRSPGSTGNLKMEAKIADLFAQSGLVHGEIRFSSMHFIPGATTVTPENGPEIPVHPMFPSWFRPGNFTEPAFSAKLVYLGQGSIEDLQAVSGTDLNGAIAIMDFQSSSAWEKMMRFGVRGFIFLSAPQMDNRNAVAKTPNSEVAVPRFFADAEQSRALLDACGQTRTCSVKVQAAPSRWEKVDLRDLWVIVPGSDPALSREMPVITAPIDGNCVAPELGQSARKGANLFLLVKLFESFKQNPPARSVMLAAVNAHSQYFLGERMLAWHLLAAPADIENVRNNLSSDLRMQELFASRYAELKLDGTQDKKDHQFLLDLREMSDESIGRLITVKDPIVAFAKRDVNEIKGNRARLEHSKDMVAQQIRDLKKKDSANEFGNQIAALQNRIKTIDAEILSLSKKQNTYVHVLTLFNKAGMKTTLLGADKEEDRKNDPGLTSEERDILKGYVKEIIDTNLKAAELNRADIETSLANSEIRKAVQNNAIPFVVTLELNWANPLVGFSSFSGIPPTRRWAQSWGGNTMRIASKMDDVAANRHPNLLQDTLTSYGGLPESHYIQTATPAIGFFIGASQPGQPPTPAFSLNTVYTDYGPVFTPADTFASLNYGQVAEVMTFVPALFQSILSDPAVTRSSELLPPPQDMALWSIQLKTFKFDEFAASVLPQIPVPGSITIIYPTEIRMFGDVPTAYMALTDDRAATVIYGIKERLTGTTLSSASYQLDPDFTFVRHTIDAGEVHLKVNSNIILEDSLILALFPCEEFPLYAFDDTSLIGSTTINMRERAYLLLSGGKNSAPRKYGFIGAVTLSGKTTPRKTLGPAAFYLQPEDRIKLLTSNKRLALNSTAEKPEGVGFQTSKEMGPDFFYNAVMDMGFLNKSRIYGMKGVSDELAQDFLKQGDGYRDEMMAARAKHDHPGYLRNLYKALGAQVKAYTQTMATTNDMLKAVIFYMALLLPFCFFLEKMCFTTSRIEVEMGIFSVLFVGTFLLFRFIHPAFRVAQYPEAIFLGFIMGTLGLFVIWILHGRFEGEMQFLLKNLSASEFTEVGYSTVSQQAMLIGVNNMKRRRIRTALTTATIVLVTFTMLSFTSISRRMNPTLVTKSASAPYTGLMYHWPGNSRMDEGTYFAIRSLFADKADVIERFWLLPEKFNGAAVPFRVSGAPGKTALIDAALGLMPQENGFLQPLPLLAGRFFTSAFADEVVLPASLAQVLGITTAEIGTQSISLLGKPYTVVGIMDDERFRGIEDINGRPLIPIKDLVSQSGGMASDDPVSVSEEEMDEAGVFYTDTSALLLMPSQTAKTIGASPYSLSIRLKNEKGIWDAVTAMLTATESKVYIASREPFAVAGEKGKETKPGIYFIGSGYRTSIGGLTLLIVPLLIASTIILNTMLGSVFERKKEIAVYNAVGLNPTHIGLFFLAESFVYSVIGSVGGYLIGQFLSLALNKFGLVSDINLNFSSLSVAYVILFTISVVLLSTIYPASVATKAAVPSGKRKWSMPPNNGTTMEVVFPFIYQIALLPGIMRYLEEYFSQFSEASTGDLIAEMLKKENALDANGRPVYTLAYHVALAPFDLGVTQKLTFRAHYDDLVQAFRVTMTTVRVSGQDSNWISTNKPFLEKLRKHMLQWRNLDAGQHELFVRKGQESFVRLAAE
jgi:ABC-type antimicrobial peptide transport system permease subunit